MMDGENFAGGTSYEPLDLFHYSAAGVRDFSGTTAGYFSPDGGTTNLGNFNTNPNGDFGDWAASVGNNSFLAFSSSGVVNPITANDLTEMNVLGWDPTTSGSAPVVTIALADDTSGGNNITANDALTGTADANATVRISEGSTVLGTTTANASGVWSFTPAGLAQGSQTITASETNAAGLTGSSSLTFTYDTTAVPTVTIALADDTSGGRHITADDALTGTADPNATVKISEGSTVLGTTTANANGVWSFTPTGLAQGMQTITASETNAAGLTGYSYLTFTYNPAAPNVTNNFTVKNDVIDLAHSEFADFAAVQADLHAISNSVVLPLDATDPITRKITLSSSCGSMQRVPKPPTVPRRISQRTRQPSQPSARRTAPRGRIPQWSRPPCPYDRNTVPQQR